MSPRSLVAHGSSVVEVDSSPPFAAALVTCVTPMLTLAAPGHADAKPAVEVPSMQHSKDSSAIWGSVIASATSVTEPNFVEAGAIPWLLLAVVAVQAGPTGGNKLTDTTYIQRLDTSEGVAPVVGCAAPADIGKKALVPYTTDYYFYRAT